MTAATAATTTAATATDRRLLPPPLPLPLLLLPIATWRSLHAHVEEELLPPTAGDDRQRLVKHGGRGATAANG